MLATVLNACNDRCVTDVDCSCIAFYRRRTRLLCNDSLSLQVARRASRLQDRQSVGGRRSRRADDCKAGPALGPRLGFACQLWIGKARTPSLRREQHFCTAEVIAAKIHSTSEAEPAAN